MQDALEEINGRPQKFTVCRTAKIGKHDLSKGEQRDIRAVLVIQ